MSSEVQRWRPAPLLPPSEQLDYALGFVIAVLVFLASLTAMGSLAADRAARGWTAQLEQSATVVVRATGNETPDAAAARIAEALAAVDGVVEARAMEKSETDRLLEPWLGPEALVEDLPTPRLVALTLDPKSPASASNLERAIAGVGVNALLDDHSRWIGDIKKGAGRARLGLILITALIVAATAAVVAFAARAGLYALRDIVEILQLSGARPGFVAGLFQMRFALLAGAAGLAGMLTALASASMLRAAGGGAGLTPVLPLAWSDLLIVLPGPLIVAAVAALYTRWASFQLLRALA
jgi:cell division transport system permease protein